MNCPFCQQELERNDLDVKLFGCENQNCKHSIHYDTVGTKDLWQELIHTRKALDIAVDALIYANKCLKGGCVNWETHIDKALKQITTLDQNDRYEMPTLW